MVETDATCSPEQIAEVRAQVPEAHALENDEIARFIVGSSMDTTGASAALK
eukprot:CAMPEP_0119429904 /NCGR_PEP_ID=MMETSP1335-20130426/43102_1 /TAXON_ID=259385 /ORGANISM="Chrysoculter rhomboideus, Strain RCC1486" /LENGTH=50 /DNA_ID=CAMNT_0007455645 /DNA_START=40 /DNA_END=189 /DNA_ORIENTATION=-